MGNTSEVEPCLLCSGKAVFKIKEFPWGYYEIQTERFSFRVYKHGGGNGRPITFRAECNVVIGERKYLITWRHFHEWDYRDKDDAFNYAKIWIQETVKSLSAELISSLEPYKEPSYENT